VDLSGRKRKRHKESDSGIRELARLEGERERGVGDSGVHEND
jgi:hypothetical protein